MRLSCPHIFLSTFWCARIVHSQARLPHGPVILPEDDAVLLREQIQWWYWTGVLDTSSEIESGGSRYGFEVCFFLVFTCICSMNIIW